MSDDGLWKIVVEENVCVSMKECQAMSSYAHESFMTIRLNIA